jgi:hypothetical protein
VPVRVRFDDLGLGFQLRDPGADHQLEGGQGLKRLVCRRLVDEWPQALGRLEFRGVRRQVAKVYAHRHFEVVGAVPAGVVERQDDLLIRADAHEFGELCQGLVHQYGADRVSEKIEKPTGFRLDEAVQVAPLVPTPAQRERTVTPQSPNASHSRNEAVPSFILSPYLDFRTRVGQGYRLDRVFKGFFLKSS